MNVKERNRLKNAELFTEIRLLSSNLKEKNYSYKKLIKITREDRNGKHQLRDFGKRELFCFCL